VDRTSPRRGPVPPLARLGGASNRAGRNNAGLADGHGKGQVATWSCPAENHRQGIPQSQVEISIRALAEASNRQRAVRSSEPLTWVVVPERGTDATWLAYWTSCS
jgi:hypothetical protein